MTGASPIATSASERWERVRDTWRDPSPLPVHHARFPHPVVVGPLLLLAAIAQWAMLRPAIPSDAISYFSWASSITENPISHGPTRLGVTIPVRIAIELFGVSETAFHLVPVALFLMMVIGTYALGTQLFGQAVGALAAAMLASSTLVFEYSSHPLPDPFASAWFVAGLALLLARTRSSPGLGRDVRTLLGALFIGIGYLCREYVILLAPVVLVLAWRQRWTRRDVALATGALIAVIVLEAALMVLLFDDPLARLRAVTGFGGSESASNVLAAYGEGATRWTVLTRAPSSFRNYNVGSLLLWCSLAVPALCLFARRTDRTAWRFVGVWMLSLWLPLILAAGLIDPSNPRIRDYHIRYWFLIVPAMFVATAAVMRQIALWVGPRWRSAVAVILVGVLAFGAAADLRSVNNTMRFRALGATHPDELRTWFQTVGQEVEEVWTDSRTARVLPLYTVTYRGRSIWDGRIRVFDPGGDYVDADELDGAIIVYDLGMRYLQRDGRPLPAEFAELRTNWTIDVARADDTLWIARPR